MSYIKNSLEEFITNKVDDIVNDEETNVNQKIEELEELGRMSETEERDEYILQEIKYLEEIKCDNCDGSGVQRYTTMHPEYVIDTCESCKGRGALYD